MSLLKYFMTFFFIFHTTMVHSSKKTRAPFGVATKRFNKIGFHPQLDVSGAMKREITKVGPGSYNPQCAQCKAKRGICWKTKLEVEEFSEFLGFRCGSVLQERAFYKSIRGPGSTDVNENFYKKNDFSVISNIGFGTGPRFKDTECKKGPPPSTYQPPDKISTVTRHQFSNIMPFEWDGFIDRFKSRAPPYLLPPNRYDINDGKGLSNLLNKVVSLRGPYDLFTGPRDGTTIKNHFTPSKHDAPEYGYVKPSDIDVLLQHPSKRRYGRFLKAPRYSKKPTVRTMLNDISLCYKNPSDPGPAHYNLSNFNSIRARKKSMYPFDTSKINARPPMEWKIFPGPGRYNPKPIKCTKQKRPSWVFLSTVKRDLYKVVNYSSF